MKKSILTAAAFVAAIAMNAQEVGYQSTYAYDDFSQVDLYKNGSNSEGMIWWEDGTGAYTITRAGDGKMIVSCDNVGANYELFGLNFNDSNDDGTGTPFQLNGAENLDITFDIENKGTSMAFMGVTLEDANGVQSKIEPNIADLDGTSWADMNRKALNGFTLAAGERKTVTLDLSSVTGAVGGLTTGAYDCNGPYDCPVTTASIDASAITTVLFQVNFGQDNIDLSEGDGDPLTETAIVGLDIERFTGDLEIHSFSIGAVPMSINDELSAVEGFNVFPNPASTSVNVTFNAGHMTDVILTDVLGNQVFAANAAAGANNMTIGTSELPTGIYLLSVSNVNGADTQKLVIK